MKAGVYKHSAESKAKISKALSGKPRKSRTTPITADEHLRRSESQKGHPNYFKEHTSESRLKISKANKGKPSKIKGIKRGPMTEEHKRKIREAKARNPCPAPNKGKPMSEQSKKKISKKIKQYHKTRTEPLPWAGKPRSKESIEKSTIGRLYYIATQVRGLNVTRAYIEKARQHPTKRLCTWCFKLKDPETFLAYGGRSQRFCTPCISAYRVFRMLGYVPDNFVLKNRCEICNVKHTSNDHRRKRLDIDHHHDTGTYRGQLCSKCNAGLGLFKEDPEVLKAAIQYLKERNPK